MKKRRKFNTSGANDPSKHYTLQREVLIQKGIELVEDEQYFTLWAPRQTGKSTYFRLLASQLEKIEYRVAWISIENYQNSTEKALFETLKIDLKDFWNIDLKAENFVDFFNEIRAYRDFKGVLIVDEVEGLNKNLFGQFLHTFRNLYHSRKNHCLKSVILVGVSNITGIVQDHASPFNIANNLQIPFFTDAETVTLLAQHETETGQLFDSKVKAKISKITANQPGLVNGFALRLVETNPTKEVITYQDYLKVEQWYLTKSIDKNVSNIIKVAKQQRTFVERLLFSQTKEEFRINHPIIKNLHTNGLITWDEKNKVKFWVPLYQKCLHDVFYPYINGEGKHIAENMIAPAYLTNDSKIDFDKLISKYKNHIQLRSFRPYREKDEKGNFKSIPEAAMAYSFETFISIFIQEIEGQSYREAFVSLGNTDIIINVKGFEYMIETKKFYSLSNFTKGKKQLAYYCSRANIKEGIYIVFIKEAIKNELINEKSETINDITIKTYLIRYDEKRDFE